MSDDYDSIQTYQKKRKAWMEPVLKQSDPRKRKKRKGSK